MSFGNGLTHFTFQCFSCGKWPLELRHKVCVVACTPGCPFRASFYKAFVGFGFSWLQRRNHLCSSCMALARHWRIRWFTKSNSVNLPGRPPKEKKKNVTFDLCPSGGVRERQFAPPWPCTPFGQGDGIQCCIGMLAGSRPTPASYAYNIIEAKRREVSRDVFFH